MEKRYGALRTIGMIYKILGIIVGVVTLLLALGTCVSTVLGGALVDQAARQFSDSSGFGAVGGAVLGIVVSLAALIYGGGASVTLYAIGEGIYLLIALEENTRATTLYLHNLLKVEKEQG